MEGGQTRCWGVEKKTFQLLFAALAVLLMILPFVTTFNSVLTSVVNKIGLYRTVQNMIVPFESRLIVTLVQLLGIPAFLAPAGERAAFYLLKGKEYFPVELQWNCLGWQSLLLLGLSLLVGLQGNFTRLSRVECVLIGLLGTFSVNLFRMVFITLGIYYINTVFALLIHDYFAALTTIAWLFFFWWFSYSFVLEKRQPFVKNEATKV